MGNVTDDKFYQCLSHGEKLDYFCPRHDEVVCEICIDNNHEGCHNIIDIDEASKGLEPSEIADVKSVVEEMAGTIEKFIKDQQDNKTNIDEQKKSILAEIKHFRDKIIEHLDRLQQDLVGDLTDTHQKISTEITEMVEELEIKRSELTSLKTNFDKVTDKEKSPFNFIIAKKVKKEYSRIKKPLNGILHGMTHSNLEFDASPEAELLVLEIESFGTIAISEKSSSLKISSQSDDLKLNLNPARDIADIKLKVKTDINLKNKPQLSVQKCVILPDNHFLFVDEKNERLVVHEQDGSHHHDISVSNKPFDVAVIDSRRIAVTYGRGRQLEILDIVKHKCEKIIKTGNDCWGMSYRDGNLFVVVYRKGIEVMSMEGQVITVIPVNVDHVFYISLHANKIYYTDWAENTVNCCDFNGSEIWCYGYDNVVSQQGIAADADGNVFVVGYRTNNVMVTSPDGRRYKILLKGESDGLNWPTGLFYDAQGDRLLICNETDGHAALYDIE